MKKSMNFLLLALVSFFVSGCETTGGTIGGLFPAPKFLKGEISSGIYTAQDKSFSVRIPQEEGGYEYKYMQVKEQINEFGAYTSFGPAAFDQGIYRVEIGRRVAPGNPAVKFDELVSKIIANYKQQFQAGYGVELRELTSQQEKINGRNAFYYRFSQFVPSGKLSNQNVTVLHDVYVIDFSNGGGVIWTSYVDSPLKDLTMKKTRAMADSLIVH